MAQVKYRKEFFDRDYSAWVAYKRVWKYARKYKFRLFLGIVSGMLTAGTLVPFFQIVQPALQHVESHDGAVGKSEQTGLQVEAQAAVQQVQAEHDALAAQRQKKNSFEKAIARNSKLPSWYPTVEKWAAKCGISLQSEKVPWQICGKSFWSMCRSRIFSSSAASMSGRY